ncbi:hypothetical protein TURU_138248 [Turdus rufiventris]|nr:hypothetical protein TURU_138248 [Turdus rufiventris]
MKSPIQPLTLGVGKNYEGIWAPAILTLRKSRTHKRKCSDEFYAVVLVIASGKLPDGTSSGTDENAPDITPPQETKDHNESPSAAEVQRW